MRKIVIAVLALAATSACADSTTTSAPPNAKAVAPAPAPRAQQACDLLTPDTISSVLGAKVEAGEQIGFECTFRKPASPQGMRQLAVRLRMEISDGTPDAVMDRFKATMRQGLRGPYDPESVIGVGDVAAWDGDTMVAGKAIAGSKSAFLLVQLSEVNPADEQRLARDLLSEAISKVRG